MIERSSNLVDRLSVSTGLAHQIAGGVTPTPHGADFASVVAAEKRSFHTKMSAVIGSGPREADRRSGDDPSEQAWSRRSSEAKAPSAASAWPKGEAVNGHAEAEDGAYSYRRFEAKPPLSPPRIRRTSTSTMLRRAPLNFSIFYSRYCEWLAVLVTWSFVIGVLTAWSA
eukprot:734369-Prymnesium_polylepis.1